MNTVSMFASNISHMIDPDTGFGETAVEIIIVSEKKEYVRRPNPDGNGTYIDDTMVMETSRFFVTPEGARALASSILNAAADGLKHRALLRLGEQLVEQEAARQEAHKKATLSAEDVEGFPS